MKGLILVLALILLSGIAQAAVIQGNIYDFNLELTHALVEINTTPAQRIVADGYYRLEVPPGNYLITAARMERDLITASTEDHISINEEGIFTIDLILFPNIDINDSDDNLSDFPDPEFDFLGERSYVPILVLIILALFIGLWIFNRKGQQSKEAPGLDDDADAEKILGYIRKHKRVTQKQIRKEFSFSQAKISLILADLEDRDEIRKIKKGRGNIIIKK